MAPLSDKVYWSAVLLLVALICVTLLALVWPEPPRPIAEPARPAVLQPDKSVIVERTDTQPRAKPPHVVPKKTRIERVVSVTVQPEVKVATGIVGTLSAQDEPCPPVTVDLSLVREADNTRRVIASSPDGRVTGGLDIPVETPVYKPRVWAAGISVDPVHQVGGVWIERDISRIRLGAEVGANRYHDFETRLKVGVTW